LFDSWKDEQLKMLEEDDTASALVALQLASSTSAKTQHAQESGNNDEAMLTFATVLAGAAHQGAQAE
jgi:hypothetical protein